MKTKAVNNAKVGLFVVAGLVFMIFTLYMIGKNRNLFGASFTIKAAITNVNGLVAGNNVRYKGIDVGTVKSIAIENDSIIYVTMTIDNKMKGFIRKNAIASIGTDGLMGNKIIHINSRPGVSEPIEEGDIIASLIPIETDEMLRTLNTTNNTIEKITRNLYDITVKLNNSESLWSLLSDTVITRDLKDAVSGLRKAATNTSQFTQNAKELIHRLEDGDGLAQQLFTDTTLSQNLAASVKEIKEASQHTSMIVRDLKEIVANVKQGEGTAGLLLSDSLLRKSLMESAVNIEEATEKFNRNMEALKSNFLFRRYFRKQEKLQKKEQNK